MPVSFAPLILPILILIGLIFGALGGWRRFLKIAAITAFVVGAILAPFLIEAANLKRTAKKGDPRAQYRYARWLENSPEKIGAVIFWPFEPDVLGGYAWLEKSSNAGYPPAIYVHGTRLKHGMHVPEPSGWKGPTGNVFPQQKEGQKLINKALALGFQPKADVSEESYYWHVYRGLFVDDPNG